MLVEGYACSSTRGFVLPAPRARRTSDGTQARGFGKPRSAAFPRGALTRATRAQAKRQGGSSGRGRPLGTARRIRSFPGAVRSCHSRDAALDVLSKFTGFRLIVLAPRSPSPWIDDKGEARATSAGWTSGRRSWCAPPLNPAATREGQSLKPAPDRQASEAPAQERVPAPDVRRALPGARLGARKGHRSAGRGEARRIVSRSGIVRAITLVSLSQAS